MPRESNLEANELAQIAIGVKMSEELTQKLIVIKKRIILQFLKEASTWTS